MPCHYFWYETITNFYMDLCSLWQPTIHLLIGFRHSKNLKDGHLGVHDIFYGIPRHHLVNILLSPSCKGVKLDTQASNIIPKNSQAMEALILEVGLLLQGVTHQIWPSPKIATFQANHTPPTICHPVHLQVEPSLELPQPWPPPNRPSEEVWPPLVPI